MQLVQVDVINYRSVESLSIDFQAHRAIGLVGVNESGKSNILRALALISPETKPSLSDVRVQRASDEDIDESRVLFSFQLSDKEVSGLIDEIKKTVVSQGNVVPTFVSKRGTRQFAEFAHSLSIAYVNVDVLTQKTDVYTYAQPDESLEVVGKWATPTSAAVNVEVPWMIPTTMAINPGGLVCLDDIILGDPPAGMHVVDAAALDELWTSKVRYLVQKQLPKALLWSYDKENLLPPTVALDAFCATPSICRPLQSMFEIAGVTDIAKEIAKEKARGRHFVDNLLQRVSDRASKHIREIWKEYRAASFDLQLDGAEIRISVKDDDLRFPFADRSDGYKRFVTFLLLISAKVKTSTLENTILLIDEPEISLHPAGIRSLRDELLRIAEKNLVVYATHSPQMIDRRCVDRHIVVKKVNEVTRCERAENGKLFDEEVLLNSLGLSVLEAVQPFNLLFEGWRDKKLFETYLHANKKVAELAVLLHAGTAHVTGVKDIRNVVPLLSLTNTLSVVVTDHDSAATDARKVYAEGRLETPWFTYRELEAGASGAVTAEDFVKVPVLKKVFEKACTQHAIAVAFPDADVGLNGRLSAMDNALKRGGIDVEQRKALLNDLKSLVYDDLKPANIEDRYSQIALALAVKARDAVEAKGAVK
jgi:energy-coupling factor transporter ATP-binding protein EcfA2